ncbi:unnamed protein product [Owenia fusiformis]|uniref:Neuroblastoma-amplified sequence n=1 Tax=Owenia fusiformis TaxID=6347 RepID=A0A8S4PS81_OWEFU|nr:unnamed protein product [Owenia fusiformis]
MDVAEEENVQENILYDLPILVEWQQEPEQSAQSHGRERIPKGVRAKTWAFINAVSGPLKARLPSLPDDTLVHLTNNLIQWQFAVSHTGREVAVLQNQAIEIRSSRDEFNSVLGRCSLPRDPRPQWRKVVWSPQDDIIAYANSYGEVTLFDLMGSKLMVIPGNVVKGDVSIDIDLSRSIASLIFTDYQPTTDWAAELLVITYRGKLVKYKISNDGDFKKEHTFHFGTHYPRGINCAIFHPLHKLIIVGSCTEESNSAMEVASASKLGLTAWRVLSDSPHYKLVTDEDALGKRQGVLWNRLKSRVRLNFRVAAQDGVFRMSLSPNGKILAVIHTFGRFSLWDVPSLRLRKTWEQADQPDALDVNPCLAENPSKQKFLKDLAQCFNLVDVGWWSDNSLIFARCSGAISVASIETLNNILGTSPEWFEPGPQISMAHDNNFLSLECESKLAVKRTLSEAHDDDYQDSDDEDATYWSKTSHYVKSALYYVTDSDRFQPPRKRPKIITKTYRLLSLKSTTPEELYSRKIKNEEYGEALMLAKAYKLDSDLVYQQQWRKAPVSVASIHDYLRKISKRSWVLHECLERVPNDIDAMREMLKYGLLGTDLETLIAVGKGKDGGKFLVSNKHDPGLEEDLEHLDNSIDEQHARLKREKERETKLLESIDSNKLTLEQIQLVQSRHKLLQYLDRLATYEEILGGIHAAEEHFDPKFFEKFRAANIIESAVDYARASDWQSLDCLFTYHSEDLLEHWLAILSNFPETMSPLEYRALLPEISIETGEVIPWSCESWREMDWCETQSFRKAVDPNPTDKGIFLYEKDTDHIAFRTEKLPESLIADWYRLRACEMEKYGGQLHHALELVELARERNVQGLELLTDDLTSMEVLVYDCGEEEAVTFESFSAMTNLEKLQLIMSSSSDEMYLKNIQRWMVPFLKRCDKQTPGDYNTILKQFLLDMAIEDLEHCSKVFECSKPDYPNPVINEEESLMQLALDCIYSCESEDQLTHAFAIIECLPHRSYGVVTEKSTALHNQVDDLERHLSVAEILETHGLPKTVSYVRDTCQDKEETVRLMRKLTAAAGRKVPTLSHEQWRQLLIDMYDIQTKVYNKTKPKQCQMILTETLLCSGRHDNIKLAGEMMNCSPDDTRDDKVPYKEAMDLVIMAAQQYFNSSANIMDPGMDLARASLQLIKGTSATIQAEYDLIASLSLLDDFGVTILPLQVRLNKKRIELVQQSIDKRPRAYKKSHKLLKLSHLLRVGGEKKKSEGSVLKLIARAALDDKDYKTAYDTCVMLMQDGFAPIWEECKALAETDDFKDIRAKADMLFFAVTHCSSDMIEPILHAKHLLDCQILWETVQKSSSPIGPKPNTPRNTKGDSPSDHTSIEGLSRDGTPNEGSSKESSPKDGDIEDKKGFPLKWVLQQTKDILTSTSGTKAALTSIKDSKVWKDTLNIFHPEKWKSSKPGNKNAKNNPMVKQGCHPFYSSIIDDNFINEDALSYCNYTMSDVDRGQKLNESLVCLAKLEETLTEGGSFEQTDNVFLQLGESTLCEDTALGLSYLLALAQPESSQSLLTGYKTTGKALHSALYYHQLLVVYTLLYQNDNTFGNYNTLGNCNTLSGKDKDIDSLNAMDISEYIDANHGSLPEEDAELMAHLKEFERLLGDYSQAIILHKLGKGVDVSRFTHDMEYKRQTIIGLTMSLEQEVYNVALTLAARYQVPMWDFYMGHVEFLFTDSGCTTEEIDERIQSLNIMDTLKSKPAEFAQFMQTNVFPFLEGTDYKRLLCYYTLLEGCTLEGLAPELHIRILKKIRAAIAGLNYKKLIDGSADPLDVISPLLTGSNVHVMAKLAKNIPNQHGGYLEGSSVFATWAIKLFWSGDQGSKEQPNTQAEWTARFEGCKEFLKKLQPGDLLHFVNSTVFQEKSLQVPLECRQQVMKRCLMHCQTEKSDKKKKDKERPTVPWEDVIEQLGIYERHLLSYEEREIQDITNNADWRQYAAMYYTSRAQVENIQELCQKIILEGSPLDLVDTILNVSGSEWTLHSALESAIDVIIRGLHDLAVAGDGLTSSVQQLTDVMKNIKSWTEKSDVVCADDIVQQLTRVYEDEDIPLETRLHVLQLLQQNFHLASDELLLLVQHQSDVIVASTWPNIKVSKESISSVESRKDLLSSLLQKSDNLEHFHALANILKTWGMLEKHLNKCDQSEKHPLCQLIQHFLALEQQLKGLGAAIVQVIIDINKSDVPLDTEVMAHVCGVLQKQGYAVEVVQAIVMSQFSALYDTAVDTINQLDQMAAEDDLTELLLTENLATKCTSSVYYSHITEYLMNNLPETKPRLDTFISQLYHSGNTILAGSLKLQQVTFHTGLLTFTSAIKMKQLDK